MPDAMRNEQAGTGSPSVPGDAPARPVSQQGTPEGQPIHAGQAMAGQRVTVRLAAALRRLVDNRGALQVELAADRPGGVTVGEVLAALEPTYPGVHHAALDERGAVRRHVNVFVGAENIRLGAGLATPVPAGAEVWILPAVSGGR